MSINIINSGGVLNLSIDGSAGPFDCDGLDEISIQAIWSSVSAFDSTMHLEGSLNGTDWNILDANLNEITLSNAADTQLWTVTVVIYKKVRLKYESNSNNSGTASIIYYGKGQL